MPTVVEQHRSQSPQSIRVAILTISDTRDRTADASGDRIEELCGQAGHILAHRTIVPDDAEQIRAWVEACQANRSIEAVILTGGTGISQRDVTIEAIEPIMTRNIPGFGELFRTLSYAEVGSATIMSRATAGLINRLVIFALPGSKAGVDLAMTRIIIPELPHLVAQARKD